MAAALLWARCRSCWPRSALSALHSSARSRRKQVISARLGRGPALPKHTAATLQALPRRCSAALPATPAVAGPAALPRRPAQPRPPLPTCAPAAPARRVACQQGGPAAAAPPFSPPAPGQCAPLRPPCRCRPPPGAAPAAHAPSPPSPASPPPCRFCCAAAPPCRSCSAAPPACRPCWLAPPPRAAPCCASDPWPQPPGCAAPPAQHPLGRLLGRGLLGPLHVQLWPRRRQLAGRTRPLRAAPPRSCRRAGCRSWQAAVGRAKKAVVVGLQRPTGIPGNTRGQLPGMGLSRGWPCEAAVAGRTGAALCAREPGLIPAPGADKKWVIMVTARSGRGDSAAPRSGRQAQPPWQGAGTSSPTARA